MSEGLVIFDCVVVNKNVLNHCNSYEFYYELTRKDLPTSRLMNQLRVFVVNGKKYVPHDVLHVHKLSSYCA